MVSRITLAIAAGLLLSSAAAMPVKAADLKGGGCCGDLEERIAELEATTARKGNRVVSLEVYGTIAVGLLVFDNGEKSDAFIVDNDAITSLLGFKGEAQIAPGLKAGYKMEFAVQSAVSSIVDDQNKNGDDNADNFSIRHNFLYIESERFGRISLGQTSTASDGAAEVSVANTLISSSPDHGTSFHPGAGLFALGDFANDFDGGRNDIVRYDTPSIYGFIASAAWGDNDYWDVALRFQKEWNSVKIAAAIAYADDQTSAVAGANFTQFIGSVSAMHMPTGLFASFSAGERDYDSGIDGSFWFTQAGIERKWTSYGKTTIYGEYGNYDDVSGGFTSEGVFAGLSTNAEMWGVGVVQHFDSAALDLYAQARFWDTESNVDALSGDLTTVMLGATISF